MLRKGSRDQPVMDCPGCAAMPWDGADASISSCFLGPFFFAKRGLGGMMTGAMGPGLAILEGRPRRELAGEYLCHPGWTSPLHRHVEHDDICTCAKPALSGGKGFRCQGC